MRVSHPNQSPPRIMVSACLVGQAVRYDGHALAADDPVLRLWLKEGCVVPFCPEVAAGLPIPRPPAEIQGGSGGSVLDRTAFVQDVDGRDVTAEFILGAEKALALCTTHSISIAVLADGSPSCGSSRIYDGRFRSRRIHGQGVATAMLRRNGIHVFSQRQFEAAHRLLRTR